MRECAVSHAALVARQFGTPAVVGVESLEIDLEVGVAGRLVEPDGRPTHVGVEQHSGGVDDGPASDGELPTRFEVDRLDPLGHRHRLAADSVIKEVREGVGRVGAGHQDPVQGPGSLYHGVGRMTLE